MGEQLEFEGLSENLEAKKDVFYVRCRPSVKKVLLLKMHKDGFTSMADWFDQFVLKTLVMRKPKVVQKKKKVRKK